MTERPASGPGEITDDGCPVDLYALLPPAGEAEIVHAALGGRPARILELGCGTGRILRPLAALGHLVYGVDGSAGMLAHLGSIPGRRARIETVDLGRTFEAVLLASHLVNTPDPPQLAALLAAVRRHLDPAGIAVIQWHPPEWFASVCEYRIERDGVDYELHNLAVNGRTLRATMTYRHGGRTWRHPFTAARLTEEDLTTALGDAGLRLRGWLDERRGWLTATRQ